MMMTVEKRGDYKICKDGTSYYRVLKGRKRIGSFLFLSDAQKYVEKRITGGYSYDEK